MMTLIVRYGKPYWTVSAISFLATDMNAATLPGTEELAPRCFRFCPSRYV